MPPLPRRARPTLTGLDEVVRTTVLQRAALLGIRADWILTRYCEAEYYPDAGTLMEEVCSRYDLSAEEVFKAVWARYGSSGPPVRVDTTSPSPGLRRNGWAFIARMHPDWLLKALPDVEFLSAVEAAAADTADGEFRGDDMPVGFEWFEYIDGLLRVNGIEYSVVPRTLTFEWVGEDFNREQVIGPALTALSDPRLAGPAEEFAEALHKRRLAGNKDLEDAIDEAAKAVESTLKVLLVEHEVAPPARQTVVALFSVLQTAGVLPGYIEKIVTGAAGARNHMASHGHGAVAREIPVAVADASVAAAGTAIALLAHYLPVTIAPT